MAIKEINKEELIVEFQKHETDSGSAEVQIIRLTDRIITLTKHLKNHKKDFSSRRGLLMLVGQRSSLLKYIKNRDFNRYKTLIGKLGIRK